MKKVILIIIMLVLLGSLAPAMESCPDKMQAVLILKIIPFIKGYESTETSFEIGIGIYGNHDILASIQSAAKKVTFKVNLFTIAENDSKLENIRVIYIPSGTSLAVIEKINALAKKKKILTVCGDPNATLEHNLTLSFYVNNDNPKILINLKSAKEEGFSFSSKILGLADTRNMEK
jgi:hypothetical protein